MDKAEVGSRTGMVISGVAGSGMASLSASMIIGDVLLRA